MQPSVASSAVSTPETLGEHFAHLATGEEKVFLVKTDLYTAEVTTKGGVLRKWELARYTTWGGFPVQIAEYDSGGDFSLLFTTVDGKVVDTRNLYFSSDFQHWRTVQLAGSDSVSVSLELNVSAGSRIIKRYTFINGTYSLRVSVAFQNLGAVIADYSYQVRWRNGLRFAEQNSIDEATYAQAYAYSGGELTGVDAGTPGELVERHLGGTTDWVATRNKYFAVALMPEAGKSQGAYLAGHRTQQPNQGVMERYEIAIRMPFRGMPSETSEFTLFLGPLDFDIIKSYERHLDEILSLGAWIIRPISEYVMVPLFQFLRMFIPNYGVVIIVFSIIIKIALHPLTKTSMKSMKKMQALQPLMTEIREKYKDDPQKMNQQIMNLYRDYGVNPAAGCLPLLLQMPILYALYVVFSSSIELRHAGFVWWITDLSIPDQLFTLPFTLPLFGISAFSGLALAMGVTMFIQQKMTIKDPRQKMMVWMMPVMLTLLFNGFPAGLNLYYFVFNLLSIIQQALLNKQHDGEPLRKVDPKNRRKGIMDRLTKDLPKLK